MAEITTGMILKDLMAEKEITQAEIARLSGLDPKTVNNIVNDKRKGEFPTIIAIAKALNVSTDYLIPVNTDECEVSNGYDIAELMQDLMNYAHQGFTTVLIENKKFVVMGNFDGNKKVHMGRHVM